MATTLLRTFREERGISQDSVAKTLGMSRPTYIALEQGKRALTLAEAKQVATLFNVLLDDIASDTRTLSSTTLPSPSRKVRPADIRVSVPQERVGKFKEVLLYVLQKVGSKPNIGMTVLYKLLYFIDFDYYEKYEEQLMGLAYIKNHHGPTPRSFAKVVKTMKAKDEIEEMRSKYYKYDQKKFLPLRTPDLSKITAQELNLIDDVLARYGDKSAVELRNISHEDTPWAVATEGKNLEYDHVFYRPDKLSVREYDAF